jgi:hypothetical protein
MSIKTEKTKVVATRVSVKTAELIGKFCRRDGHVNVADFIRDAIREKLQKKRRLSFVVTFSKRPSPMGFSTKVQDAALHQSKTQQHVSDT